MKTNILTALSVAALLGSGTFAIAQDAGVNVDVNAGAGAETSTETDSAEPPAAYAVVGAEADTTFEGLNSALTGSATADLSGVTDESKVTIVLLSSLSGDAAAFDEAHSANAEGNTTLHSNVSGNSTISAKLEAEGYSADDVVAVRTGADGAVTVYVDDRS